MKVPTEVEIILGVCPSPANVSALILKLHGCVDNAGLPGVVGTIYRLALLPPTGPGVKIPV